MPFEEPVDVLGELWTDSLRGGDLLHGGLPQPIYRTEFSQQQIFPVLTHAWTIIEDAFADALLHQELMIGIRETVRFVANPLEQAQRSGIRRQNQRQRAPGAVNFLVLFRQTDDRQVMQPEPLEFATGRGKLSFATVDDDQVR